MFYTQEYTHADRYENKKEGNDILLMVNFVGKFDIVSPTEQKLKTHIYCGNVQLSKKKKKRIR